MATAKKTKIKKPAVKRVSTAQLAAEAAAKKSVKAGVETAKSAVVSDGANAGKRKPGRPPGSGKGKPGRKPGQKSAGRPAATEFLYIVRPVVKDDEMGLPTSNVPATAIDVVGPFPSEEAAQTAAIEQIGTNTGLEVTLFRDYKRGRPEVKVRLV
jgi:hypothetical protein